ncbi:uncharacterized protein LOC144887589 [Branchiostoma floridae x Branchiostoma japonicum]
MAAMCCKTGAFLGIMSLKRFLSRSSVMSSRLYNQVCTRTVCRYHRTENWPTICSKSDAKLSRNLCHRWSSSQDLDERRLGLQNTGLLHVGWSPYRSINHRLLTSDGSDRTGESSYEAEAVTERPQEREARLKGVFTIDELVEELRGENVKDICVIKVPVSLQYVDFLVIVSGSSTRHLKSIAQYVISLHKDHKDARDKFVTVEGADCDDWMAIDLGNIALHMMLPETREKYELEKLWTLGSDYDDQTRDISFLNFPFALSDQFEMLQTEE